MRTLGRIAVAIGAVFLVPWSPAKSDAPRIAHPTKSGSRLLATGRSLYVTRCIECHSLPRPREYSAAAWPALVRKMSARAGLTPADEQAVTAYILALRRL